MIFCKRDLGVPTDDAEWRRVITCRIFMSHFPQKGPIISGSFAESDQRLEARGGGLGSRPKKMYGERLGDGVEYHLMKPTPRR